MSLAPKLKDFASARADAISWPSSIRGAAGIALIHNMAVVTRNVVFAPMGAAVIKSLGMSDRRS